jgi:hypothetical protein
METKTRDNRAENEIRDPVLERSDRKILKRINQFRKRDDKNKPRANEKSEGKQRQR